MMSGELRPTFVTTGQNRYEAVVRTGADATLSNLTIWAVTKTPQPLQAPSVIGTAILRFENVPVPHLDVILTKVSMRSVHYVVKYEFTSAQRLVKVYRLHKANEDDPALGPMSLNTVYQHRTVFDENLRPVNFRVDNLILTIDRTNHYWYPHLSDTDTKMSGHVLPRVYFLDPASAPNVPVYDRMLFPLFYPIYVGVRSVERVPFPVSEDQYEAPRGPTPTSSVQSESITFRFELPYKTQRVIVQAPSAFSAEPGGNYTSSQLFYLTGDADQKQKRVPGPNGGNFVVARDEYSVYMSTSFFQSERSYFPRVPAEEILVWNSVSALLNGGAQVVDQTRPVGVVNFQQQWIERNLLYTYLRVLLRKQLQLEGRPTFRYYRFMSSMRINIREFYWTRGPITEREKAFNDIIDLNEDSQEMRQALTLLTTADDRRVFNRRLKTSVDLRLPPALFQ